MSNPVEGGGVVGNLTAVPSRSLLNKIIAGLSACAGGQNPAQRPPLLPPTPWATATQYIQGMVVCGIAGAALNLYICTVAIAASATAPTGTLTATQVDGAGAWQYLGPVTTTVAQAGAPAVSFAASTGAGSNSYFWVNPAETTQKYATGSPNFFTFEGGFWQAANQFGGAPGYNNYAQLGASNTGSTTVGGITSNFWANPNGSVTFCTDAPKIMIGGLQNTNTGSALGGFVEIDDVPLSDGPLYNFANNGFGLVIDYTGATASAGRKVRKYRIYTGNFMGVSVFDNVSQVWAYRSPNSYKIGWIGDSISAGSAGGPFGGLQASAMCRFSRMVGCENLFNQSVGGMGFVNPINGYTFQTAALSLTLFNPDVIIICGNYDDAGYASSVRQAAVISCLQYLRATFPNAMIIGFGPWGSVQNGSAAWIALENDLAVSWASLNDNNMFFIPLIVRPSGVPWVSGTANSAAPGLGNSSVVVYSDSTHPVCYAHREFIPQVYYQAYKQLIASLN